MAPEINIPDSVVVAYVVAAVKMHGSAGADIGDEVRGPDSGERIGRTPAGDAWRVADGWGTFYILDPPRGEAIYICSKLEDVMAVDVSPQFKAVVDYRELGMGDAKWDAAVLAALGGESSDD